MNKFVRILFEKIHDLIVKKKLFDKKYDLTVRNKMIATFSLLLGILIIFFFSSFLFDNEKVPLKLDEESKIVLPENELAEKVPLSENISDQEDKEIDFKKKKSRQTTSSSSKK